MFPTVFSSQVITDVHLLLPWASVSYIYFLELWIFFSFNFKKKILIYFLAYLFFGWVFIFWLIYFFVGCLLLHTGFL